MKVRSILNNFPEKQERKRIFVTFDHAEKIIKKEYLEIIRELRKRVF